MGYIPDTARGIVIKDGKILLMERWRDGLHYYSIPGGKIEKGESRQQTVVRELMEETSVVVRAVRLVAELKAEGSTHFIFLCDYLSGEPALQPDSEEAIIADRHNRFRPCWQPASNLDNLYLRYWEALKPVIVAGLREGFKSKPAVIRAQ